MNNIKAAIIDDGAAEFQLGTCKSYSISRNLEVSQTEIGDNYGFHAGMCMAVMNRYVKNDGIEWLNIRIIDHNTGTSSRERLIKALELCYDNDVKVINMSIGTTEYCDFPSVSDAVNKLVQKGVIIVAALSNVNKLTYPACLDKVIGVKADPGIKDDRLIYVCNSPERIQFLASSRHLVKIGSHYDFTILSNSFAAPVVTARVLNILKEYGELDFSGVMKKLIEESDQRAFELPEPKKDGNDITVPVVGISLNDRKKAEESAEMLCRKFIDDGYCAVSQNIAEYESMSRDGADVLALLNYYIGFSGCDIVLLLLNDDFFISHQFRFDVIVTDTDMKVTDEQCEAVIRADMSSDIYEELILKFKE